MTQAQVLALINLWIVANGNNEITADVLRPILEAMVNQPNDAIGDLTLLDTTDKTNLVTAINEIFNTAGVGITIHPGTTDPNITPPASYSLGDFYEWNDGGLVGFYQYNGTQWVLVKSLNTEDDLISSDAGNMVQAGTDGKIWVANQTSVPIENVYDDINSVGGLLDSQINQTQGFIQKVLDASDDPNVTISVGETTVRYYEYLGTVTADLDDYQLLTPTQQVAIESQSFNSFAVGAIDTSIGSTVDAGKILIQYEGVGDTVTNVLFPVNFSLFLTSMNTLLSGGTHRISLQLYNNTNGKWSGEKAVDFTAVGGGYAKVVLSNGEISRLDFAVNDVVKVYFSLYEVSGLGDMLASTYDPTSVVGDAFNMDNMAEGTDTKILTAAEREILDNTSGVNTGDQDLSSYATVDLLSSNISLYPTTTISDIGGYYRMVDDITDPDYDDPAVDVPTGAITGSNQLIANLVADANLFVGNPGVISITTIGNIRKVTGATGSDAQFYFEVYHRNSGGTETLIGTSNSTIVITEAVYAQFFTAAIINNGNFTSTDRIVVKYYATKVGTGADPTYDIQFGGTTPVRTLIPVPVSVIPSDAHNNLIGLQGGTTDEYYHLTSAEHTVVGNTSGTNTGDQDLTPYALTSAIPTYEGDKSTVLFVGDAIWISGLTFYVYAEKYKINGVLRDGFISATIICDAAPTTGTLKRIDSFIIQNDGLGDDISNDSIIAVKGDEADNPLRPILDNETQLEISFALFDTNATEPTGTGTLETELIWNGETALWTLTESAASIDPANTTNPIGGTTDMLCTNVPSGTDIYFSTGTEQFVSGDSVLAFDIKLDQVWEYTVSNTKCINVFFWLDNKRFTDRLRLGEGNGFNFDGYNTTDVQTVYMRLDRFPKIYTSNTYNKIQLEFDKLQAKTMHLDNFRIISGFSSNTTTYENDFVIAGLLSKTTLVDADNIPLSDSEDSNANKKTTWAIIKATLKTYFDTLYNFYTHPNHTGEVTGSGALTVDKTAITNKTAVTVDGADYILISQTSDTGNLKKILASDLLGGSTAILKETDAAVTGTKAIDWATYGTFVYTMTGATTFSDSNLPTGDETNNITMVLTGDFVAIFPVYWQFGGDPYVGTVNNVLACEVTEGDSGVEKVVCIITNLT